MFACVCMFVNVHMYLHVCMGMYMCFDVYLCMHVCMCMHTRVHTYLHMFACVACKYVACYIHVTSFFHSPIGCRIIRTGSECRAR